MGKQPDVRFSRKLGEHINEREKNWPIENPIAAIMLVSADGREDELALMFYDRGELLSLGEPSILSSDGIEFIIPQTQIHSDLDGRVLDIRNGKITLVD